MTKTSGLIAICCALLLMTSGEALAGRLDCAGVIITEIMYNPSGAQGSDSFNEWIEIYNDGCDEISLEGWTIEDLVSQDPILPLDAGPASLAPKTYALIIDGTGSQVLTNPAWTIPAGTRIFGTDDAAIGNGLTNGPEEIVLRDSTTAVVDAVMYTTTDASGCGNEADGDGYSLERVDPLGPGDCSNFRSMELLPFPIGGTPGSENHLWIGDSCVCEGACCLNLPGAVTECAITTEADCADNGHIYFGDGSTCPDNDLECQHLIVEMDDMMAVHTPAGVQLRWTTATEIDTIGFRVLRELPGRRQKSMQAISQLVPASGNSLSGASYQFLDNARQLPSDVRYYIEDVDVYGKITRHGPIAVQHGPRTRSTQRSER